uniref:Pentatricopeptide repeat-containing protein n=1 Tax=Chenopodium quinoa TaxID=63459 RepID=A0A803N7D7_CHEQI
MMEEAEDLFYEMQNRNLKPTTITYAALLNGYNRTGNGLKLISLFNDLLTSGVMPDEVVYSLMVDTYRREGNWKRVFQMMDELSLKGLTLKENVWDSLVETLSQKDQFSEVLQLLDDMEQQGLMLSSSTCMNLIRALSQSRHSDKAAKVLDTLVQFRWVPNCTSLNDFNQIHDQDNFQSSDSLSGQRALNVANLVEGFGKDFMLLLHVEKDREKVTLWPSVWQATKVLINSKECNMVKSIQLYITALSLNSTM